jgi:hypothetical protein
MTMRDCYSENPKVERRAAFVVLVLLGIGVLIGALIVL